MSEEMISEQAGELSRRIAHEVAPLDETDLPSPTDLQAALVMLKEDLLTRVRAMESMVGFLDLELGLAERVARLEKFLGVK